MQITYIENIVTNFSFSFLFCMMIYYWFRIAFYPLSDSPSVKPWSRFKTDGPLVFDPQGKDTVVTSTKMRDVTANQVTNNIIFNPTRFLKSIIDAIPFYGMLFTNLCIASLLVLRWIQSAHLPLSNLYESLIFLTWSITLIQLIIEKTSNVFFLGILLCPLSLLIFGFANFSLPSEMQNITPLVPALQSNWLLMHVSIMILSYGTLLCGCIFSITYLCLTFVSFLNESPSISVRPDSTVLTSTKVPGVSANQGFNEVKSQGSEATWTSSQGNKLLAFEESQGGTGFWLKFPNKLDNLSYRMLGIGFSFLTIGILSGAVWANETWGSYWSWDPKETWAFITWLIFAIYLHSRLNYGWQGKKPAIIASVGFIIIWICYLGVNLLGKGLHSYGWIQGS